MLTSFLYHFRRAEKTSSKSSEMDPMKTKSSSSDGNHSSSILKSALGSKTSTRLSESDAIDMAAHSFYNPSLAANLGYANNYQEFSPAIYQLLSAGQLSLSNSLGLEQYASLNRNIESKQSSQSKNKSRSKTTSQPSRSSGSSHSLLNHEASPVSSLATSSAGSKLFNSSYGVPCSTADYTALFLNNPTFIANYLQSTAGDFPNNYHAIKSSTTPSAASVAAAISSYSDKTAAQLSPNRNASSDYLSPETYLRLSSTKLQHVNSLIETPSISASQTLIAPPRSSPCSTDSSSRHNISLHISNSSSNNNNNSHNNGHASSSNGHSSSSAHSSSRGKSPAKSNVKVTSPEQKAATGDTRAESSAPVGGGQSSKDETTVQISQQDLIKDAITNTARYGWQSSV